MRELGQTPRFARWSAARKGRRAPRCLSRNPITDDNELELLHHVPGLDLRHASVVQAEVRHV